MNNQEKKPLYFYGQKPYTVTKNNKKEKIVRRFALAGIIGDDGIISIGKAVCSEKDIFTKKKARAIATGRAGKKQKQEGLLKVKEGETPGTSFVNYAKKYQKEEE